MASLLANQLIPPGLLQSLLTARPASPVSHLPLRAVQGLRAHACPPRERCGVVGEAIPNMAIKARWRDFTTALLIPLPTLDGHTPPRLESSAPVRRPDHLSKGVPEPMSGHVTNRLSEARRQRFVGRTAERSLFGEALTAQELPFQLLYIFGPGGVGKTTLLHEYAEMCKQVDAPAMYLDARGIEPSPGGFIHALEQALDLSPSDSVFRALASRPVRHVILLDTHESLEQLDAWLRETFLPRLSDNVLVVLAGRNPPAPPWRADPGWQTFVRMLALRNLSPDESRAYLERRNLPAEQYQSILDFTHGHPLALSLVADAYAQRPGVRFQPEMAPDVIKILLEQFVQKVPGPGHRAALEACALVRVTTEGLLAQMLEQVGPAAGATPSEGVHELFEWLRGLSFIESGYGGLFPHDLAREALIADLRWRNPDWFTELHSRAREYYIARVQQTHGLAQQHLLLDLVFLHRDNPVIRSMLEWQTGSGIVPDALRDSDRAALVAMVAQYEGDESARLAAQWLERQPEGVTVYREENGQPAGFLEVVELQRATEAEIHSDPAARAVWEYLMREAPLRLGEIAAHYRFWMARDTYQAVSPVQTLILLTTVRYQLTTPGLAYHFLPCSDPDFWMGAFTYANLVRLPEIDYQTGERKFGVYAHDWRVEPPSAWLALLAQREVAAQPQAVAPPARTHRIVVLSQPDFSSAVRSALRDYARPEALRDNPLLQSRLIAQKSGQGAGLTERAETLRGLLKQAAESLQASPKNAKLCRALFHTFFQPAATQEQAAEALNLPFSTYRRHLTGIERVTEILWREEIGG